MGSTIEMNTTVARREDVAACAIGDQVVIFSADSGMYYDVNRVGSRIWEALETPTTPAMICARLRTIYDVTNEQCEAEVLKYLRTLYAEGVLRVIE